MEIQIKNQEEQLVEQLKTAGFDYDYAGCYAITINGYIAYIGKSANLLKRLAQHILGVRYPEAQTANKYRVLHDAKEQGHQVSFMPIYKAENQNQDQVMFDEIGFKEAELINKHRPLLNYQIPNMDNYHRYRTNKIAKTINLDYFLEVCGEGQV